MRLAPLPPAPPPRREERRRRPALAFSTLYCLYNFGWIAAFCTHFVISMTTWYSHADPVCRSLINYLLDVAVLGIPVPHHTILTSHRSARLLWRIGHTEVGGLIRR